ncbi:MAG: hypothetical protein J6N72_00660 [Psychrobacter sp.]|nr:hypothetical protein [Psychrobacter sp.]
MFNLNLRKILIGLVVIVIISPPVALYIQHKINPPAVLYELVYTEVLTDTDKEANSLPIKLNFCFEVPVDLDLEGDLQEFMVALTHENISQIVMSDVTNIKKFTYQTQKGCGDYTALIAKEDTRDAYELFKSGEMR